MSLDDAGLPAEIRADWPGISTPFRLWTAAPNDPTPTATWRDLLAAKQHVLLLGPWHRLGESWKSAARDGELYVVRAKVRPAASGSASAP